ncbi:tripartite tricarboxylate transporter TctB family protein [Neorhizobium vignae]|uniref:tripartite tricarboxylate transporter TctB family protein n=1 Tax=Neorhizobium vignae TaxID=690585 RepID=UPI000560D954|nr:tripartite tricarboxylate transporter TctB family protein [Neorhizobium vignae]
MNEMKNATGRSTVRAPQNLAGGLALMAVAGLALWLLGDLNAGSLSEMGSALMPRALAVGLGLMGLVLAVSAFLRPGLIIERTKLHGLVLVLLAIAFFAVTIRPFAIGPVTIPGLGLIISAPVAIVIAGLATPEARFRELVALALGLTPFCMLMFGDLLNLPIPVFPASLIDSFPEGWSQKAVLRIASAVMLAAAVLVFVTDRQKSVSDQGNQG